MATTMEMPAPRLESHTPMVSGLNVGKDHVGRMQGGQGSPWKLSAVAEAGHHPKKDLRRAHTVAQGRDISTRDPPRGAERVRTKSLRRAKNSQEALAHPLGHPKEVDVTSDGFGIGREPRHFTVGNVGNNGKIYLRYAPVIRVDNGKGNNALDLSINRLTHDLGFSDQ